MPLSTQVGDAAVSLPMPYFKDEPLLTVVGHMKMNDKENGQVANRPTITIDEMKKPGVVKHIFAEPEIPADLSLKKFILNHNHTAAVKDKYSTLHTFVDTDTLDKYIAASAQGGK